MATIIREMETGDGYNVTIILLGQNHTLHFLSKPSDIERDATITAFESRLQAELMGEEIEENMREVIE